MGTHLVNLLSQQDCELVVTSRSRADIVGKVRYLRGSALDTRFLNPILTREKWSAVIDFMVYSSAAFKLRVQPLLDSTAQYIFLSSSRVYAQSSMPLKEDSPRLLDVCNDQTYLATDEYALTKARQEDLLFASGRSNWTIIRPYITFSEERLQLGVLEKEDWLFRGLNGRTIVFSKDINDRLTTMTYGEDVAKAVAAIIGEAEASGEAFHITNPDSIRWSDVMESYLSTIQEQRKVTTKVLLLDLSQFIKAHPSNYQITYDRLYDRTFDNSKINQFIDTSEFKNPAHALQSCLETFLQVPRYKHISGRYEALKDLITNERTPLGQIPGLRQKALYVATRLLDNPTQSVTYDL